VQIITVLKPIIEPMERSIPPDMRRRVIDIVQIPKTAICWKIAKILPWLKNRGFMIPKRRERPTITTMRKKI
jgi:hypothetical protein